MTAIEDLDAYFKKLRRLSYISSLLGWDQEVNMPEGSAKGRSEQIALISEIYHKKLISEKTGKLIKAAEKQDDLNLIESAYVREARRKYDKAVKIPVELSVEISKAASLGQEAWKKSRAKDDFSIFQPHLKKLIGLRKEYADKLDIGKTRYDALLDDYEPGATSEWISKVFGDLKTQLSKILDKLNTSSDKPNQEILKKSYDKQKQWDLSMEVIKKLNFDLNIGRQDKSTHPFTSSLSSQDVRITTRINENFLNECLFGTIHECGHALYEMGYMEELHDTILADGSSLGIHEAMSRTYENIVGRSKEFWTYWYPILQDYFPSVLKNYPKEEFYRSINSVQPSLIRVEADEVTYSMHIILRFELEKKLINEESIKIEELPQIWDTMMDEYLGITPPDQAKGVLQDIHWSMSAFGYFPTYALGNLYGAQIYKKALEVNPDLPKDYENGDFSNLLGFMRENVHRFGKIHEPRDLIKKVTGEKLNPQYFIDYVKDKFYPVYKL